MLKFVSPYQTLSSLQGYQLKVQDRSEQDTFQIKKQKTPKDSHHNLSTFMIQYILT